MARKKVTEKPEVKKLPRKKCEKIIIEDHIGIRPYTSLKNDLELIGRKLYDLKDSIDSLSFKLSALVFISSIFFISQIIFFITSFK